VRAHGSNCRLIRRESYVLNELSGYQVSSYSSILRTRSIDYNAVRRVCPELAQLPQFEGANLGFSGIFPAKLALHFTDQRRGDAREV
jgi:hypothetical protein